MGAVIFAHKPGGRVWVLSYDWDGLPKTRTFHFNDQDEAIGQRQDMLASWRCTYAVIDLVKLPGV